MRRTNTERRYTGTSSHRPDLLKLRQEEALERQTAFGKLSTQEKLAVLDARLGKDVGAKKQRARLNAPVLVVSDKKASQ